MRQPPGRSLTVLLGLILWKPALGFLIGEGGGEGFNSISSRNHNPTGYYLPHQPTRYSITPTTISICYPSALKNQNHQQQSASTTRYLTCLTTQKRDEDENKSKNKEERKGPFRNLFSNNKEDENDSSKAKEEKQQEDQGILRFFNRGGDKQNDTQKDKKKDNKGEGKREGGGGGGIFKGIASRFGGGSDGGKDKAENLKEASKDTEPTKELPIDMRPTYVRIKRPPTRQVLPKGGTRSIPADIMKSGGKKPLSRSSTVTTSSTPSTRSSPVRVEKKPTPEKKKTIPPPKAVNQAESQQKKKEIKIKPSQPRKTRRIIEKVRGIDSKQDEGSSVVGRVQRLFEDRDESKKGDDKDKKQRKREEKEKKKKIKEEKLARSSGSSRSGRPMSVAQKFVSNMFQNDDSEQWVPVFPKTRITPGEIVPVTVAGLDLIVVASKDAQNIYCMQNACPHLGTPLEVGFLERRPIEQNNYDPSSSGGGGLVAPLKESDVAALLASDGCEDCIICPLHKTAFALKSGEVRGEWCPYPPVLGKMTSAVKNSNSAAVFDVRTKGKNIEVRLNTPIKPIGTPPAEDSDNKDGGGGEGK